MWTGVRRGSHDPPERRPKVSRSRRQPRLHRHSRFQSTVRRKETFGRTLVRGQETRAQQESPCPAQHRRILKDVLDDHFNRSFASAEPAACVASKRPCDVGLYPEGGCREPSIFDLVFLGTRNQPWSRSNDAQNTNSFNGCTKIPKVPKITSSARVRNLRKIALCDPWREFAPALG
jgi:hypothetical protein